MNRIKTLLISLVPAFAGCVAMYEPVRQGPVAYVKFTDSMPPNMLGGRRTAVFFYENTDCARPASIPSSDWVAVPANREVGFHHFFDNRGAGLVQGYCGVWSRMTLQEGQRVELKFDMQFVGGLRVRCDETASDMTSGSGGRQIALTPLRGEQCKY